MFSALSQSVRLDAFRLLVQAGQIGLTAGELSEHLDVRANTLSANLSVLLNARLVKNRREGRAIRYFADMDQFRALMEFLMEDCCGGQPGLCQPVLDALVCHDGRVE